MGTSQVSRAGGDRWSELARWLRSADGDSMVDAVVLGEAVAYEVDELLEDYGFVPSRETRRRFAQLVDAAAVS